MTAGELILLICITGHGGTGCVGKLQRCWLKASTPNYSKCLKLSTEKKFRLGTVVPGKELPPNASARDVCEMGVVSIPVDAEALITKCAERMGLFE